tara:strand:- start:665 stop:1990 length:1326 start_codon:yes stop_codon:yes gene_type:complete
MNNIKNKNNYLIFLLISIYLLSRYILYDYFQIKADPNVLKPGWHVLDLYFLNKDLLNSILYLHSQPPLWNLIIGIFTKIVNGNLINTSILLNLLNYVLTIGIITFTYKILIEFKVTKKLSFFITLILVIFNPNVIFYENITIYNHLLAFLFTQLFWLVIKFFKTKKNLYEFLLYLNICIQSLVWAGMHPVILIFFFIVISLLKKSLFNLGSICFMIIFFISLSPLIKNKIIFNKFSNSTWLGINLASTLNNLDDAQCLYQIIYPDSYESYRLNYNREIHHPIARANSGYAYRNSVTQIFFSDTCLSKSLQQIKKTPIEYIKGRFIATVVSHSKFGFEYIYLRPQNFSFNNFFYDKKFLKITKQFIIIIYMLLFYIFLTKKIFTKNNYRAEFILILSTYIFCNLISHLFNGYEQERFMYQFQILHVIFIAKIMSYFLYEKKN